MFEAQDGSPRQINSGRFRPHSLLVSDAWSPLLSAVTARSSAGLRSWDQKPGLLGPGRDVLEVLRDGAHQQRSPKEVKASSQERMLSCPLGKQDQGNTDSWRASVSDVLGGVMPTSLESVKSSLSGGVMLAQESSEI